MITHLETHIESVWKDSEEFEEYGSDFYVFITWRDVIDMDDDEWDTRECIEEFSDIIINSIRAISLFSEDTPEDCIQSELYQSFVNDRFPNPESSRNAAMLITESVDRIEEDSDNTVEYISFCCITAMRAIQRFSERSVKEEVLDRLYGRMADHTDKLITKVVHEYEQTR
jgi:hypothetical protein